MNDIIELKVKEVRQEISDAISIVFENPTSGLPLYKPGQFLTTIVDINGKEERRSYSLSSSPFTDAEMAVTVKRVKGGKVSNYLNEAVKAGDTMKLLEPMGNFVCEPDKDKQRHIILLGGGSGITPMMSILKSVLTQEPQSMVSLIFANTNRNSVIFYDAIEEYKTKYNDRLRVIHHWDSKEVEVKKKGLFKSKTKIKEKGFLNTKVLTEYFSDLNIDTSDNHNFYYMCGPNGMMDVIEKTLSKLNAPKENVYKEVFVSNVNVTPATFTDGDDAKDVLIKFNGEEYNLKVKSTQSILQVALNKGINLPFSCQGGLCTACMGKCLEGEVDLSDNQALTDGEIADGAILTCIGKPISDRVVIEIE